MSIDLTQFHAAFYQESFEAIAAMEEALLRLDIGAPDAESINTIFRVAHSIKGAAATFGFSQIGSFTHSLESVLEQLRAQRLRVTQPLSELLLRSVDIMRELLRAQQARAPIDAQRVTDVQFELESAVLRAAREPTRSSSVAPGTACVSGGGGVSGQRSQLYQIHFRPHAQLLVRGNDPLRMFRELRALGELQVSADLSALPPLAALDPEQCYLSWTLRLRTAAPRAAILEVFEWAETDCTLAVTAIEASAAEAAAPGSEPPASAASNLEPAAAGARAPDTARRADAAYVRVGVDKIEDLMNSVGELVITQSMLGQIGALCEGHAAAERLRSGLAQLERNVRELQESVMRVRMMPISFAFSRFPRMVRDLSQRLGKQVELKFTGGETELDKTVLEKIGDPLMHLIRNSIDHGIELPDRRRALGKRECGLVHLHAYHRAGSITVEVRDDGAGLQCERILAKARERALIGALDEPSEAAIHNLIFLAGFSTVEQATEVSGRGVGMDVVKRNVEALGGSIEVHSVQGEGARFVITLPITLAIIDGQTITVGEESYIVPLSAIVESVQVGGTLIKQVLGHGEVCAFRGEFLPVVRLERIFRSRSRRREPDACDGLLMVVEGEGRRVGLLVDELLGQQQVVVKSLQTNYGQVEGIAGATILGNGAVALILDIAALARAASALQAA